MSNARYPAGIIPQDVIRGQGNAHF